MSGLPSRSQGDSRFSRDRERDRDRDRSPFRERRGSISSIRNSDYSYRPGDNNSDSRNNSGPLRGPSFNRGGSYASSGRGYGPSTARDARDTREGQSYRRDSDRDSRRDSSPRRRSRTPPQTRDFRDERESRNAAGLRSLDTSRVTRDSRDNAPLSAVSTSSDGGFGRGNFRNRPRGDWSGGRRNFEADRHRPSSRSRDRRDRDRDDRGRDDRRDERSRDDRGREYDRDSRRDDDLRDRDGDRIRKDPPQRPDSRNSVISQAASAVATGVIDRRDMPKPPNFTVDTSRRSSFAQGSGKPELSRGLSSAQSPSSPVEYPQVPQFGQFRPTSTPVEAPRPSSDPLAKDDASPVFNIENLDPTRIAPKGPKADLTAQQAPIGPKALARRPGFPDQTPVARRFEPGLDSPAIPSPAVSRFGVGTSPTFNQAPPSGPRSSTWVSPELTSRLAPGSAPSLESRPLKENEPPGRPAEIRIPTGPKADRDSSLRTPLSARTNKPGAMTWVNPNLPQQSQYRPSIMGSMHHKKEETYAGRPSATSPIKDTRPGSRSSAMGETGLRRISTDMTSARRLTLSPSTAPSAIQGLRDSDGEDEDEDDDDDDEDEEEEDEDAANDDGAEEEDEDYEFNQQYYKQQEAKFEKSIASLTRQFAPEPHINPKIRTALDNIDVYASAIQDLRNGILPPPAEPEQNRQPSIMSPTANVKTATIPTPPAETSEIKDEEDKKGLFDEVIEELPLDGLEWLNRKPLTPKSFGFAEDERTEYELSDRVRIQLKIKDDEDQRLQEDWADCYRVWRDEVDRLDEEQALREAIATRAATPLSTLGTETAGTPAPDAGRRSARNATEMDIERVMRETAEEAQAAEIAQSSVDMSVDPDMMREAEIPSMFTEEDQKLSVFDDINNRVPTAPDIMESTEDNPVLKHFLYMPEEDDFDSDDQERFQEAYAKHPKQWGKLARSMNEQAEQWLTEKLTQGEKAPVPKRRDYHECIAHYYTTKKTAKPAYKNLPNRKTKPKKKNNGPGRRGARSSMLGGGEDGSTRMSDTGRPKRAAAPSFNDKEKQAEAQKQAKEKKSSTLLKPTGADGTPAPEKTPARKSRKKDGEKSVKRGAKGAAALAPNISPARMPDQGLGGDVQMQDAFGSQNLEDAQLLAGLQGYANVPNPPQQQQQQITAPTPAQSAPAFPGGSQNETWRVDPRIQAPPAQGLHMASTMVLQPQPNGVPVLQPGLAQRTSLSMQPAPFQARQLSPGIQSGMSSNNAGGRAAGATSSYWSVQEQTLFHELIRRYGRDWNAIGQYLPLKTEQMIKNFYERGGKGSGHDPEGKAKLEEIANEVERLKRDNGGQLPTIPPFEPAPPTTAPNPSSLRRRGAGSQRPIAPNLEQMPDIVQSTDHRAMMVPPPVAQGSPQANSHSRIAPARQPVIPITTGAEGHISQRTVSSVQGSRAAPTVPQPPLLASDAARAEEERLRGIPRGSREPAANFMNQSKRPLSISEQDRHVLEQPPKRQGLSVEEFSGLAAHQFELQQQRERQQQLQQQHQQDMYRSESQRSTEYNARTASRAQPGWSQMEISRPNEPESRNYYPSTGSPPLQYRDRPTFGMPNYGQPATSHPGSMASVMGGSRTISSPSQRPIAEPPRPNSVATVVSTTSNRPTPAPSQKRSNIMSLLNDDPPEERKAPDPPSRPATIAPPARHDSPLTNASMYRQPPAAPPQQAMYQRREAIEPVREPQRGYPPPPAPNYGQPATQTQPYSGPPSQPYTYSHQQSRDPYPSMYNQPSRTHEQTRLGYGGPPHPGSPDATQHLPYNHPQYRETPSHASGGQTISHSRAASYGMSSGSAVAPGQALAPSPYADIRPSNIAQPLSHPPAPTSTQQHPIYHPGPQGPNMAGGNSRAATAYPGQIGHDPRRGEEQIPRYSTPSHTPPNPANYGYPPPR